MARTDTEESLADRLRDDPFPLFGGAVVCIVLAVVAVALLHGGAVAAVGTSMMFAAAVFLAASAFFGVSGYRRRTGRSRSR